MNSQDPVAKGWVGVGEMGRIRIGRGRMGGVRKQDWVGCVRNLEKICKSKFLLKKPLMILNKVQRVKREGRGGFLEQRTICWQGER